MVPMKPLTWILAGGAVLAAALAGWLVARPVTLTTVRLSPLPLTQTLVFSGRVASPLRVELGATLTGRVTQVLVREGDRAAAGQLLAQIDSTEASAQLAQAEAGLELAKARAEGQRDLALPASRAALAQAQANLDAARIEAARSRDLLARGFIAPARGDESERAVQVAQAQLDAATAGARVNSSEGNESVQAALRIREAQAAAALAQARVQQTRIVAPAAGRVVLRSVDPGQIVQPGKVLFQFALTGSTQLIAQADEKFLSLLAPGQRAQVVVDAFSDQPFAATLASIAPGIDAQRGTVEVKFSVPQPPPFLREDMTLSLQLVVGGKAQAMTLPATAVLGAGSDGKVRLIRDDKIIEQTVRVGLRTLQQAEIVAGLPTDAVVVAEPLKAAPGTRARAAEPR
jgi:HlyD family secretion protein